MAIEFYGHPFSSYCWKALIAFYENDVPFEWRSLEQPENNDELEKRWPLKRFPAIVDGNRFISEASIIIEYLDVHYRGPVKLIPADADKAIDVRMLDRFFDNYVMTPSQKRVFDAIRPEGSRDPAGVDDAATQISKAYQILDRWVATREWAAGTDFSLADCAAAPALFYADWTHPIPEELSHVRDYRARLLARPSVIRCVDAARPYREYFPLGAPDRD